MKRKLRATILESNNDATSVRDVYESHTSRVGLLKYVKRSLVRRPPANRQVVIQVSDVETGAMIHNKPWVVPEAYVG